MIGALVTLIAALAADSSSPAPAPIKATRGLAGSVEIDPGRSRLVARADQTPDSAVVVRLLPGTDSSHQKIEFVGFIAGAFDLRDFLQREDGADASDLPPLPVIVESRLAPGHGEDVLGLAQSLSAGGMHYRALLIGVGAAWALVPVVVIARRAMRNRPQPQAAPIAPPPDLAAQIRALLDECGAAPMTVAQQGRLELLILRFWTDRVAQGEESAAEAIALVRRDERTRRIVLAVESWLHAHRDEAGRARGQAEAAALIEAFRREELAAAPTPVMQGGGA